MSNELRFGDLEFLVLWEITTGGHFPPPFAFRSRTPMYYDFLREKHEMVEQLRRRWDHSHDKLVEVITQPDLRIVVKGYGSRNADEADGRLRTIGLRRGGRGYVIDQLHGETFSYSGGFVVAECDPVLLADKVLAALPEQGPGRHADVALVADGESGSVDYEFGRSQIADSLEDPVGHRSKSFLNTPMTSFGAIEITQGHSKFGPRGLVTHQLQWRDLVNDGRYLIGGGPSRVALAVDTQRMVAAVNARVAAVVQNIREERGL